MRADSGFYTHAIVAVCRKMKVRFSVTVRQHRSLRSLIEAIPEGDWTPIPYWMEGAADVAEAEYTPFKSEPDAAPVRLIVRRVKPTPGSQLALFANYSYHACITNREGGTLELEAGHRRHAEIENAIRDLKYGVGLNHLPSGRFAANAAWLAIQVMAHNLSRWTAPVGLGEPVATTKTSTTAAQTPTRRSQIRFVSSEKLALDVAGPSGITRCSTSRARAAPHPASPPALALGNPVLQRPGPIVRPATPLLTAALASDPSPGLLTCVADRRQPAPRPSSAAI